MRAVEQVGYWSALAAFVAAAGYSIAQILQVVQVLSFPWDDILIFGFSLCIAIPFVLAMVALHHVMPEEKRIWTHSAVVLGVIYAVLVTIVYVTQLVVVIPARLAGQSSEVAILMVSPHSFMWVLDGAGYILMGLATLFAAGAFAQNRSQKWLRWFLIANGLLDPVIMAIYIFPSLLLVGTVWIITAPGSLLLLALFFKKQRAQYLEFGAAP